MRDIKALALRVEEPTEKLLIFRAVAKLSVINEHHMGDECMKLLRRGIRSLMKGRWDAGASRNCIRKRRRRSLACCRS